MERLKRNRNAGISIEGDESRGYTTVENYVIKLPYLSPNPRSILYAFFMYQNCPETFISYSTLQTYTGISSKTSITKWLRFLEWIGFLNIRRFTDQEGVRYNIYKINHIRIKDFASYMNEMDLDFRDIEGFYNANSKSQTDVNNLLNDKDSFVNALKSILESKKK